jgi:hypothetical protein
MKSRAARPSTSNRLRVSWSCASNRTHALYGRRRAMNENFSLVVMCIFLLLSLAFLAQQLTSYH